MNAELITWDVQAWLDAYIDAWRTYDPDAITALFSADVRYEPEPWVVLQGHDAVLRVWDDQRDEPGSWHAEYSPLLIAGRVAVAAGTSTYHDEPDDVVYHNLFVLTFDDEGRCVHYRESYMRRP